MEGGLPGPAPPDFEVGVAGDAGAAVLPKAEERRAAHVGRRNPAEEGAAAPAPQADLLAVELKPRESARVGEPLAHAADRAPGNERGEDDKFHGDAEERVGGE